MTASNAGQDDATHHRPQSAARSIRSLVFCLMFFVLATLLLAVVVLLLFVYMPVNTCGPEVCSTRECIEVGAFITQNVNFSADPCEDFFQYACGGYVEKNRYGSQTIKTGIGAYVDMIKTLQSKIFEMLYLENIASTNDREMAQLYNISRDMFHSCMNWHAAYWAKADVLASFVDPLFAFVTEGVRTNQLTSLEHLLGRLVKIGATGIMKLELTEEELSAVTSAESEDSAQLNETKICILTDLFGFTTNWTQEDLRPVIDALAFNDTMDFAKILFLKHRVAELVATQNKLYEIIQSSSTDLNDTTFFGTASDLQKSVVPGAFNWSVFLYHVFDREIAPNYLISIKNSVILRKVLDSMSQAARFQIDSYGNETSFLLLDAVLSFAKFFPKRLQQQVARLKSGGIPVLSTDSTRDEGNYPKFCLLFAMTSMQQVVVHMFTGAYIKQGFNDIHSIIDDVKVAMEQNVDDENWISEHGKQSIKSKIRSVKKSVGYESMSADTIKAYFSSVRKMYKKNKGFGHLVGLFQAIETRKIAQIMTANSTVSYFFVNSPLQVNAFNFMDKNTIVFPMGILGPYLYDPSYPVYLRYGGIGTVIGHEIGHSFDDMGHELTNTGSEGHFWDNSTEAEYINRTKCLVDAFGEMELGRGVRLNGNATLGNNIADILGISSAYRALQNNLALKGTQKPQRLPGVLRQLTPEMMFFVQFAQIWCEKVPPEVYVTRYRWPTHSPPKLRILGSLKNSREFTEAFGCKPKSGMNPENKCRLW